MQSNKNKILNNNVKLNNLRLKNENSNSSRDIIDSNVQSCSKSTANNQKTCINDELITKINKKNIFDLTNAEDSLADFVSPKKKISAKTILSKFRLETNKGNKKVLKSKIKSNTKSRKNISDTTELLESPFFEPQIPNQNEVNKSIPCPLCLKLFKDEIICNDHVKSCALKNKISTKQLLKAKQLQDRQIEERKAMGLLPTPVLPKKKKACRIKNFSTNDDPQLQLALAVSESLYQAEQKIKLEQAALLAGIPTNYINEMNYEDHRTTLQNFGFTTNKSLNDISSSRSKKRKLLGPTILQTRSKEENDHIFTERIISILRNENTFSQCQQNPKIIAQSNSPTILRSKFLQKIEQVNNKLWDKSRLLEKCDFYVEELKSYFLVQESKSNDFKLSSNNINNDEKNTISLNSSEQHEIMDLDIICDENKEQNISNSLIINESENINWELTYTNNIVFDWREGLNDSASSDTIIFVKNNEYVYAHKLVFYVRHINILLDIKLNNTDIHPQIQNKICWTEIDKLSSLAFLEYIYCGNIKKNINVFNDDNLMSQIRKLGRLYSVKDFFEYLQRKQKEFSFRIQKDFKNNDNSNIDNHLGNLNTNQKVIKNTIKRLSASDIKTNTSSEIQSMQTIDSMTKSNSSTSLSKSIMNDTSFNHFHEDNYIDKRIAVSPDLFESENEEEKIYSYISQNNNNIEKKKQESSDTSSQNSEIYIIKENANETECINSPQIVEIRSPENEKPVTFSSVEDIYEAVTPKNSPRNYDDMISKVVTPEFNTSKIDEVIETITPKSNRLSIPDNCTTPKKAVRTNVEINDIMHEETIVRNDHTLIHTAVTPQKSDNSEFQLSRKKLGMFKSNLSLFIDKVRKQNSKSIFDTDSESDTPECQIKKRNPFLKDNRYDSLSYLFNKENENKEYKSNISLIEGKILEEERKMNEINNIKYNSKKNKRLSNSSEMHDLSTNQCSNTELNHDMCDKYVKINDSHKIQKSNILSSETQSKNIKLSHNVTLESNSRNENEKSTNFSMHDDEFRDMIDNENQISMYSQYKKSNKYDNSIEKYRNQLDFNNIFSNNSKTELSDSYAATLNPVINDITLVSDSDEEERNMTISDINNGSSYQGRLIDIQLDQLSTVLKQNSKKKISDSVLNSNKNADSEFSYKQTINSSNSAKTTNKNKHEQFLEISERKNDDVDAEIKKIIQSSPIFKFEDETFLQEFPRINSRKNQDVNKINMNKNYNSQREIRNLSPILIISSPESCKMDKDNLDQYNNQFEILDSSKKKQFDELDLIKNSYFDKLKFQTKSLLRNEDIKSETESSQLIADSNIHKKILICQDNPLKYINENINLSSNSSSIQNSHISHHISSPILNKNSKTIDVSSSKSSAIQKIQNELLEELSKKPTKHKTKCKQTTQKISKFDKCHLQKSASSTIPEQNKKLLQKSSKYKDATPPIDYNLLKTPDLEKELKKYGLKRQSRNKAKLLLSHIYNETHPIITLSQKRTSVSFSSSEDEEPLYKTQNVRKKFKSSTSRESDELKVAQNLENCPMTVEEIDYNEPNTTNTLENSANIRDAFCRLIEDNKELHSKILTYKPLPLESSHLMLNKNGFKCKLKNFMHFLDEQCITFQAQTDKQLSRKKK